MRELIGALREFTTVSDLMDQVMCEALEITRTDARCLDVLERLGPTGAGELARASGVTSGAMTGVIDRLEARGYARRRADDTDRRRVVVEATEQAVIDTGAFWGPVAEDMRGHLDDLDDTYLATITAFLRAMNEAVRTKVLER